MKDYLFTKLIICFLAFANTLSAQDTLGIQQLIHAAQNANSPDEAYQYYLNAYSYSRQLNYDKGLASTLPKLAEWELDLANNAGALRYLLEELDLVKNPSRTSRRTILQSMIGDIYFSEGLYAESLPYYQKANRAIAIQDEKQKTILLQKLGDTFSELSQPDSAFHFYAQLPVWRKLGKESFNGQINALHDVVIAYNKANDYEKALRFNQRILGRMKNESVDHQALFIIYNNLGYNYNLLAQYTSAIEYFEKAIELVVSHA